MGTLNAQTLLGTVGLAWIVRINGVASAGFPHLFAHLPPPSSSRASPMPGFLPQVRSSSAKQGSLIVMVGCAFLLGWVLGSASQFDTPYVEPPPPDAQWLNHYDMMVDVWHNRLPRWQPRLHPVVVALGEVLVCLVAIVSAAPSHELRRTSGAKTDSE